MLNRSRDFPEDPSWFFMIDILFQTLPCFSSHLSEREGKREIRVLKTMLLIVTAETCFDSVLKLRCSWRGFLTAPLEGFRITNNALHLVVEQFNG